MHRTLKSKFKIILLQITQMIPTICKKVPSQQVARSTERRKRAFITDAIR